MEAEVDEGKRWFARPLVDLRWAAASGDSVAQAVLGRCYHYGLNGIAVSTPLAAAWRAKAAASGHTAAQTDLGWHYDFGEGVVQDRTEGVRLYRLAAKQGDAAAMHNLGLALKSGEGCEPDPVRAILWVRRAADLGSAEAQGQLAMWYRKGDCSLPTNYKEAHRLARLGAAQGNAFSMRELGYLYGHGLGVAANRDVSCRWCRQAAALGDEDSKRALLYFKHMHMGEAPALAAVRELGLGPL